MFVRPYVCIVSIAIKVLSCMSEKREKKEN